MLGKLEEISLIARCVAADDRHAFGRLVEEYQDALRRFIYNLCGGDAAMTDDIAQETFLKAYTSIRSFKGISRFKPWLYTIAYREFIDWRRSKGGYSDDLELAANISDNTPNPEHSTEAAHDISVALSALNETEKSLVLLFYMEDLPIKKISDITGIPQGTVKVYLARSRTKMAKILETDESNR